MKKTFVFFTCFILQPFVLQGMESKNKAQLWGTIPKMYAPRTVPYSPFAYLSGLNSPADIILRKKETFTGPSEALMQAVLGDAFFTLKQEEMLQLAISYEKILQKQDEELKRKQFVEASIQPEDFCYVNTAFEAFRKKRKVHQGFDTSTAEQQTVRILETQPEKTRRAQQHTPSPTNSAADYSVALFRLYTLLLWKKPTSKDARYDYQVKAIQYLSRAIQSKHETARAILKAIFKEEYSWWFFQVIREECYETEARYQFAVLEKLEHKMKNLSIPDFSLLHSLEDVHKMFVFLAEEKGVLWAGRCLGDLYSGRYAPPSHYGIPTITIPPTPGTAESRLNRCDRIEGFIEEIWDIVAEEEESLSSLSPALANVLQADDADRFVFQYSKSPKQTNPYQEYFFKYSYKGLAEYGSYLCFVRSHLLANKAHMQLIPWKYWMRASEHYFFGITKGDPESFDGFFAMRPHLVREGQRLPHEDQDGRDVCCCFTYLYAPLVHARGRLITQPIPVANPPYASAYFTFLYSFYTMFMHEHKHTFFDDDFPAVLEVASRDRESIVQLHARRWQEECTIEDLQTVLDMLYFFSPDEASNHAIKNTASFLHSYYEQVRKRIMCWPPQDLESATMFMKDMQGMITHYYSKLLQWDAQSKLTSYETSIFKDVLRDAMLCDAFLSRWLSERKEENFWKEKTQRILEKNIDSLL